MYTAADDGLCREKGRNQFREIRCASSFLQPATAADSCLYMYARIVSDRFDRVMMRRRLFAVILS